METAIVIDDQYSSAQDESRTDSAPEPESTDSNVIVELKNIHKTYLLGIEGVPALRGVSLQFLRGEFVVIFGTSGGGKTSLLNIVGTIDKPTKGQLAICDTWIHPKTKDDVLANLRLSKLGFVFQTFNLISSMTALENVELPMILKDSLSPSARRKRAMESLNKVGMSHRYDHFPSQLSGGEQQRVTIARAIANNPELLLLDEPTGDLDTDNSERVLDLLIQLNREGMTMIMVTHDMYLKNFANRVVWMRDGKVARVETIQPEKREKAIHELSLKLAEKNASKSASNGKSAYTEDKKARTEVRSPLDYATFVFGEKLRQQKTSGIVQSPPPLPSTAGHMQDKPNSSVLPRIMKTQAMVTTE